MDNLGDALRILALALSLGGTLPAAIGLRRLRERQQRRETQWREVGRYQQQPSTTGLGTPEQRIDWIAHHAEQMRAEAARGRP